MCSFWMLNLVVDEVTNEFWSVNHLACRATFYRLPAMQNVAGVYFKTSSTVVHYCTSKAILLKSTKTQEATDECERLESTCTSPWYWTQLTGWIPVLPFLNNILYIIILFRWSPGGEIETSRRTHFTRQHPHNCSGITTHGQQHFTASHFLLYHHSTIAPRYVNQHRPSNDRRLPVIPLWPQRRSVSVSIPIYLAE